MGEKNDGAAKAAAVMSSTAAVASVMALLKEAKAQAAPGGIPEELFQLLIAIAASIDVLNATALQVLEKLGGGEAGGRFWPENRLKVQSARVLCPIAGRAYQLPYQEVPDGMAVTIKALPTNAVGGLIFVATSQAEASNLDQSYWLIRSEPISYYVKNVNAFWVASSVPGDGIVWTVEG